MMQLVQHVVYVSARIHQVPQLGMHHAEEHCIY